MVFTSQFGEAFLSVFTQLSVLVVNVWVCRAGALHGVRPHVILVRTTFEQRAGLHDIDEGSSSVLKIRSFGSVDDRGGSTA
ncbi:hypothetical protein D1231_06945 [Henriciella mobilis]|uniref:Uncharacterized protein n=1 Tax=Henriciella mobilis TaxID=2305467 RepID=A0A399RRQ3_9PROT|nr:hypothetical protein D1231_06945 [Henriciella mobilis]RIJ33013.1 hypothetical protein D1223_03990 [Henriciella mobilis]